MLFPSMAIYLDDLLDEAPRHTAVFSMETAPVQDFLPRYFSPADMSFLSQFCGGGSGHVV